MIDFDVIEDARDGLKRLGMGNSSGGNNGFDHMSMVRKFLLSRNN